MEEQKANVNEMLPCEYCNTLIVNPDLYPNVKRGSPNSPPPPFANLNRDKNRLNTQVENTHAHTHTYNIIYNIFNSVHSCIYQSITSIPHFCAELAWHVSGRGKLASLQHRVACDAAEARASASVAFAYTHQQQSTHLPAQKQ